MSSTWTPNQIRVIRDLLEWDENLNPLRGPTPTREGFRAELLVTLEELTRETAERFSAREEQLTVSKYDISSVHKCEGLYVAPETFGWTVASARGRVVHRAIQKTLAGAYKEMPPMEVIREAVESIARDSDDTSFADFIAGLSPSLMGELLSEAGAMLTAFQSDWPPLGPAMQPRIEPPIHVTLHGGSVLLRGRYDLALGPPGRGPVVITDLKSGIEQPEHRDEARYYALLETLKTGIPPIRVASYYLDGGWFRSEDVSEDVLQSAIRRTGVGINLIGSLRHGKTPTLSPGRHCRFCGALPECVVGQEWLAAQGERSKS